MMAPIQITLQHSGSLDNFENSIRATVGPQQYEYTGSFQLDSTHVSATFGARTPISGFENMSLTGHASWVNDYSMSLTASNGNKEFLANGNVALDPFSVHFTVN